MTGAVNESTLDNFEFRVIAPNDYDAIKALHEEFFPVRYSDHFFHQSCLSIGFKGGQLFTSLCVNKSTNQVIGFIFAQILPEYGCEDSGLLGNSTPRSSSALKQEQHDSPNTSSNYVCYILTVGLKPEYRRTGLGSELLRRCIAYAETNRYCGAVYLHVIESNPAAIAFYKKNGFLHFRTLDAFYSINGSDHTALLLIIYINSYQGPAWHRLYTSIHQTVKNVMDWIVFSMGFSRGSGASFATDGGDAPNIRGSSSV